MAQQLCPEEFSRVIASDVKLKSISIELAPYSSLKTQLDIKTPWLDEMRIDQRRGYLGRSGVFKAKLTDMEWKG